MKGHTTKKVEVEDLPLETKAEMALKEAVADAIAEHKLRGHPIVVWRDGKVVTVPADEIAVSQVKESGPGFRTGAEKKIAVHTKPKRAGKEKS